MKNKLTVKQVIPPLVSLALFMETLDATIINTAIPTMARSFDVNPLDLKFALISYLLSLAIFVPISGWLVDKYGARRIFITALGIFTLSSIASGLARGLPFLILARLIQGFGGALMGPVGRLIIVNLFERNELLKIMNKVITVMLVGPALGPVVGGYIVHYFSWRWIFFVNVPFGCLAIILTSLYLKKGASTQANPFNFLEFFSFGLSAALLTFGLSALSEDFLSVTLAIHLILIACLGFTVYFLISRHQPFPLLPFHLLAWRTFKVATLGNMFFRIGQGAMMFSSPLFLQICLGYSPLAAGLLLVPVAVGSVFGKMLIQSMLLQFGYRRSLFVNGLLFGVSICAYAIIFQTTHWIFIGFAGLFFGLWLSMLMSSMNSLFYAEVEIEDNSKASSFYSTLQQLFQGFGVAFGALLLKSFTYPSPGDTVLFVSAFHQTFLIMGGLTMAGSFVFFALKPSDGENMLKKK